MKKLLKNLLGLLITSLLISSHAFGITIMPSSQQNWAIAGLPESTLVLGQGGTIYVGDTVLDTTTWRTYEIIAVGTFDVNSQTYIDCEFKEYIFDSNISDFTGINKARAPTNISTPTFNTSRQPNATRDVNIMASVTLTSILIGSAMVTPQISENNSSWVNLPAPKQLNIAQTQDWPINFIVPAGYYYRLVSSTSGIGSATTLNSIQELSN